MSLNHAAIRKVKLNQNVETKARSIVQNFLKLDEDRFDILEATPDRITKAIRKIVKNEISKANYNEIPKRRELSPVFHNEDLNFRKKDFKRRALSPCTKDTYIAINNSSIKNDRYQEHPYNHKLKLINAYMKSRELKFKDPPCQHQNNVKEVNSPKRENRAILSMMKNYTYRFLKSPQSDCNSNTIYQDRPCKNLQKDRSIDKSSNTSDSYNSKADKSKRIIFGSPFYNKRNKMASKFKEFDKKISDKEILEYRAQIFKTLNSNWVTAQ